MRKRFICLLILIGFAVNVKTVQADITGKITDADGKGVEGAVCSLMVKGVKATSGSDGTYKLVTTGVSQMASVRPHTQAITLNKSVLELSLNKSAAVKIEIFDAKGNLQLRKNEKNVQAGLYRFNIGETSLSTKLLIIRAAIGNEMKSFRYLPLNNGMLAANSSAKNSSISNGTLAKVAAAVDTLMVTADGFDTLKKEIPTYEQEAMDITLIKTVAEDMLAVRLDQEKQTIQGFGVNACLMEGGMFNVDECFGLEGNDALGMSVLRIGMNTDGGHRGVPSGWEKARDQYGAKVIGSCWSAPKEWKTNGSENDGGHLYENRYKDWAERIANYAKKYNLYAMSIANEADFSSACAGSPPCTDHYASMTYTGKMMVDFVKEARKAFDKICPDVKMIAPEASLWIHVWSNISPDGTVLPGAPNGGYHSSDPHGCGCYANEITEEAAAKCAEKCNNGEGYDYGHWLAKDEEAWNAIDILGVHEYESQVAYPWPDDVTGGVRTKEVWQTEMSGVMYWPEQGPSAHIENGVAVARWIQSALTIGEASAWCYWWYGPPYYSSDDNEGLAMIKGSNQKTKRYYTFGNYSRYMRPGQTVVNVTGIDKLPEKVLLTASKDDEGKVVIVAVNETKSAQSIDIPITGGTAPTSFKTYLTNGSVNWDEGTATITDGVLTMELEATSVTTFVGE